MAGKKTGNKSKATGTGTPSGSGKAANSKTGNATNNAGGATASTGSDGNVSGTTSSAAAGADRIEEGERSSAIVSSSSSGASASGKSRFGKLLEAMPALTEKSGHVVKRLAVSTGAAAWIVVTAGLILALPLIIEMDREAQLIEVESQQMGVLTGTTTPQSEPSN